MDERSIDDMTNSQFLRDVAHTAEIGDLLEDRQIKRIREIAIDLDEQTGA